LPTRPVGGVTGVVLANSGIDIALHEGEVRVWTRFYIDVKEIPLSDLFDRSVILDSLICKNKKETRRFRPLNARSDLSITAHLIVTIYTSSCCRAMKVVINSWSPNKLMSQLKRLTIRIAPLQINKIGTTTISPCHITTLRMSYCSKKRPNRFAFTIWSRSFSTLPRWMKYITVQPPEDLCNLSMIRKADKSLLFVRETEKGDFVRSDKSTSLPKEDNIIDFLKQVSPDKDGIYTKLTTNFLSKPKFLLLAYSMIKSKPGNLTPGAGKEKTTLDGINKQWFIKAAEQIKSNNYKFKPSRRIEIPKKGFNKKRPLTISSPRDKIIQKAIQILLENIFEYKSNYFSRFSHGFRPNKSCHTALQQIKDEWTAIPWFIKVDIEKAFDTINKNKMIALLRKKVIDHRLFRLIILMLKNEISSPLGIIRKDSGVPQGNILSPLLSNIYFHELDTFIEKEIIARYKKGSKATKCAEYQKMITLNKTEKKLSTTKRKQLLRVKRREAHKKGLRYTKIDDSYIRIKYVRYADDFIIGVRGSKEIAAKILNSTKFFLKSNLHLKINEGKSEIINTYSNKVPFLGMLIYNVPSRLLPYRKSRAVENYKRKKSRVLARIDNLNNKQTKMLKDECLKLLRSSFKRNRNNRKEIKSDLSNILENSITFKDLINTPKRAIYREFINELKRTTEAAQNERLKDFLSLWEKELYTSNNNEREDIMIPLTKTETIKRVVSLLRDHHDLPARYVDWHDIYKGKMNKNRAKDWKPIWPDKFKLSEDTSQNLRKPENGIYNSRMNSENIRLVIDEIIHKYVSKSDNYSITRIVSNNAASVRKTWDHFGSYTNLPPQIKANTDEIYARLIDNDIINTKKAPISKAAITRMESSLIISYYNSLVKGILSYYRCADNFYTIKNIVLFRIRTSLLKTLAHKHKTTTSQIIESYSKKIKTTGRKGKTIEFIDSTEVSNLQKKFLINPTTDPFEYLSRTFFSLQRAAISSEYCAIINCLETETEVYHIRKLYRNVDKNNHIIVKGRAKTLKGIKAIDSALNRKQIPLCSKHHKDWHRGLLNKSHLKEEWK
jgi:group II intron reverse transcriptase/maturase